VSARGRDGRGKMRRDRHSWRKKKTGAASRSKKATPRCSLIFSRGTGVNDHPGELLGPKERERNEVNHKKKPKDRREKGIGRKKIEGKNNAEQTDGVDYSAAQQARATGLRETEVKKRGK